MLPASTRKALVQSIATSTVLKKHVRAVTDVLLAAVKTAVVEVEAGVAVEVAAEAAVEEVAEEGANQF